MAEVDDEQRCLQNSLAGDETAYMALVQRYQKMIHALTYRMTGSLDDADDLAQETFIRAFHQLGSFRGEAKFSTWLCRIAMNVCLNWRQREGKRNEVHHRWAAETFNNDPPANKDDSLDETGERVRQALGRLPAKQRAAIVLTVYQGLNHAEAARVLGCSETTVSWRLFAARNKLKRWLKPLAPAHD
jgi:RNA polymerase sigma-70 factor (ECF subfamily)